MMDRKGMKNLSNCQISTCKLLPKVHTAAQTTLEAWNDGKATEICWRCYINKFLVLNEVKIYSDGSSGYENGAKSVWFLHIREPHTAAETCPKARNEGNAVVICRLSYLNKISVSKKIKSTVMNQKIKIISFLHISCWRSCILLDIQFLKQETKLDC